MPYDDDGAAWLSIYQKHKGIFVEIHQFVMTDIGHKVLIVDLYVFDDLHH
jgi:hypothetical protein